MRGGFLLEIGIVMCEDEGIIGSAQDELGAVRQHHE